MAEDQLLCECELLPRRALVEAAEARPGMNLDDFRRAAAARDGPVPGRLLHATARPGSSTASGWPTPSAPTSWC